MYDLNAFTPAQAADPSLPAELIAQLAAARPDLHAVLLENPSMYPQLRQWIIDTNAQREPQFVYGSGVPRQVEHFPLSLKLTTSQSPKAALRRRLRSCRRVRHRSQDSTPRRRIRHRPR